MKKRDPVLIMKSRVKLQGLRECARQIGCDAGNLCAALKGRRPLSPPMLRWIGMEVVK